MTTYNSKINGGGDDIWYVLVGEGVIMRSMKMV